MKAIKHRVSDKLSIVWMRPAFPAKLTASRVTRKKRNTHRDCIIHDDIADNKESQKITKNVNRKLLERLH